MLRTVLAALVLLVSSAASATTFNASGTLADGSTITGFIVIDTVAGTLDDSTFTITGPTITGTFDQYGSSPDIGGTGFWGAATRNGAATWDFNFALFGTAGGLIGYSGGTFGGNLFDPAHFQAGPAVTAGTVSAVPLPASALLLFGAIATLALVGRRQEAR